MQTSTGNLTGKAVGQSRWLLVGVGLGVGLGVCGLAAQILLRRSPAAAATAATRISQLWSRLGTLGARKYYRGGFQVSGDYRNIIKNIFIYFYI